MQNDHIVYNLDVAFMISYFSIRARHNMNIHMTPRVWEHYVSCKIEFYEIEYWLNEYFLNEKQCSII